MRDILLEEEYALESFWLVKLGGEGWRLLRCAIISALAAAVLAYHYLVISGVGNPDALAEGLLVYTGYDWALACGRWTIRYMSHWLSGNVVIPGLWVPLYALCCGVSAWLVCRLWNIRHMGLQCLVSVLMTVNPTVIEQSLLQYMFMAWGLSNVLCVMFVYFVCTDKNLPRRLLLYPAFIALAFGLYQACLGILALMLCMTLALELLDGRCLKDIARLCLSFVISAAIGVVLYFVVLRLELYRWGEMESGRLTAFSIREIFASLPQSLPNAYKTFFGYFFDSIFARAVIYKLIFAAILLIALVIAIRLIKEQKWLNSLLALLLILAIPACANISDIVFPYNKPVLIMQYQSILVIPFMFALIQRVALNYRRVAEPGRCAAMLLVLVLAWGYAVSANATYRVYERSYNYTYSVVSSALDKVYALPDYSPGEPIAFAGFPDDSLVRDTPAYDIAYGKYENLIFWDGYVGLQGGRTNYLRYFFGLDGGVLPYEKFIAVLETGEFEKMNIFPQENSVRRIDDLIIIKFDEEFPLYE